jgi:anhydro-N-acetylmuramic acid kinase
MTTLSRVISKRNRLVVGLMSGTSVDCIDAALISITGSGTSTKFKQLAFVSHPYPKGFREYVLRNSLPGSGSVDTISTLNILIAQFFVDAVKAVARKARIPCAKIDLIGSHGQTIHHLPTARRLFGKSVRSTLQIGDPSTIAKLTGIITVGDFRTGDMALGGQGAPLVPYFDFLAFRLAQKSRALLNIGGIANITLLPKNCSVRDVLAFDTGPGNMIIDALMKKLYGKEFDENGVVASKGRILTNVIRFMLVHPYLKQEPPKSTGREVFGKMFVDEILRRTRGARKQDIIATVTEFTPLAIYQQYAQFLRKRCRLDELIVSGGGAHNGYIMEALRRYFAPAEIMTSDDLGISSDSKEAVCFAILANETISGNPSNVPGATGARSPTILGKICL